MDALRRVPGIQMGGNRDRWAKGVIMVSPFLLGLYGKAQEGTYND